jgi:glycosyltransferase involved in cell wall biosynthesis
MDWPEISIVICTLNCVENLRSCLGSIRAQDYPSELLEVLVVDSHSTDGTIETATELGATVLLTDTRGCSEGRGMPKSIGCSAAKGTIIITLDSDNMLVEPDWLKKMVAPLINGSGANYCICRQFLNPEDPLINRYLALVGTDPFSRFGHVDAQLSMGKMKLEDRGAFWMHSMDRESYLISGGHYLAVRKDVLESIGGYSRDTDVTYSLVTSGRGTLAIPKDAHVHHRIAADWNEYMHKKIKWGRYYFERGVDEPGRVFFWMDGWTGRFGKLNFGWQIMKAVLLFPEAITSLRMLLRSGQREWLLHAPMCAITTWCYCYAFLTAKGSPRRASGTETELA